MSKTYVLSLFICVVALQFSQSVFAQAPKDSINNKTLFTGVEDKFYEDIGPQSHLFNGIDYEAYSSTFKGNAYFLDNGEWNAGSIIYDGYLYKNVPMLY